MIIQCINCTKKFEVDSTLVPENGRSVQCGACNYKWFYKPKPTDSFTVQQNKDISTEIQISESQENNKNLEKIANENKKVSKKEILPQKIKNKKKNTQLTITSNKASTKFGLIKILSYFIVLIISFIGIIIFLDTFKSVLSNFFPGLELLLYNLFESIKDINLFIKDLI
jgi:predicted Zn finger-like uncharacterized protein